MVQGERNNEVSWGEGKLSEKVKRENSEIVRVRGVVKSPLAI